VGGLDIFDLGIGWGQRLLAGLLLAGLSSFFDWRNSKLFFQLVNFLITLMDGLVPCPFRIDPYCDRWMGQNMARLNGPQRLLVGLKYRDRTI